MENMHCHLVAQGIKRQTILNYVYQSLLAVLVLVGILYLLDITTHATIVAALGASTFIVFAMPHSVTARPRNVIGGHLVGVLAGVLCSLPLSVLSHPGPLHQGMLYITLCSLSVGLAILGMVLSDTGHPPAAGTALGIAAHPWSWRIIAFVLVSSILLSLAGRMLRPRLRDLV